MERQSEILNYEYKITENILNVINKQENDKITNIINSYGKSKFRKVGINPIGNIIIPCEGRSTITGDNSVTKNTLDLVTPLTKNMVLTRAGAQIYWDMSGEVSFPKLPEITSYWKSENDVVIDGMAGMTFDELSLTPKRLTTYLYVSLEFLNQTNKSNTSKIIMSEMTKSISNKLESTILGSHETDVTIPDGMFTSYIGDSYTGTTSYDLLVNIENELLENNGYGEKVCMITNPAELKVLRNTELSVGTGNYVYKDGKVLDYPVFVTKNVPSTLITDSNGVILGNFENMVIVNFGGLDITVDNYSKSKDGIVQLIINSYWNYGWLRPTYVLASLK